MRRYTLIVDILFCLMLARFAAAESPVRVRMPNSGYSARMIGVAGTAAEGDTIAGAYNSSLQAHEFNITHTGQYKLYYDPAGGSSWSIWSDWGDGSNGKAVMGTDMITFAATLDSSFLITAASMKDSIITLAKFTQAALNFISSGGNITNNPDDNTIENKTGSTLGVKKAALDSTYLTQLTNRILHNSRKSSGYYQERKTVEYAGLKEAVYANGAAPRGGKIVGEAGITETIVNENRININSNTHISLPVNYVVDHYLTSSVDSTGLFKIDGAENVIIEGGYYKGNAANNGFQNEHVHCFDIRNSSNVILRNMVIEDWAGDAFYFRNVKHVLLDNVIIIQRYVSLTPIVCRQAISIVNGSDGDPVSMDINVSNVLIIGGCGFSAIDIEPNVTGLIKEINFTNVTARADTFGLGRGFTIAANNNCAVENVNLTNCNFIGYRYGSQLSGDGITRNIKFNTCTFDSCTHYGIYINEFEGVTFENSTVSNTSVNDGVLIQHDCEELHFNQFSCYNNARNGLYAYGAGGYKIRNLSITNSQFYNNGQDQTSPRYGIFLVDVDTVRVTDNDCYDNQVAASQNRGIYLSSCGDSHLIGNWCFGNEDSDNITLSNVPDSSLTFGFNRAGDNFQASPSGDLYLTLDGQTKLDSAWQIVISSAPGDSAPVIGTSLVKGELHANHTSAHTSDRGFMRLSAGGGANVASKAGIDIQGYSANAEHSTLVGLHAGGIYSGVARTGYWHAPLGLKVGQYGSVAEIDSITNSGGSWYFWNDGTSTAVGTSGGYLPLSGGTMTGPLVLGYAPTTRRDPVLQLTAGSYMSKSASIIVKVSSFTFNEFETSLEGGGMTSGLWLHQFDYSSPGYMIDSVLSVIAGDFDLCKGSFSIHGNQWNSGDYIDGEQIANGTVDGDALDLTDITLSDFINDIVKMVLDTLAVDDSLYAAKARFDKIGVGPSDTEFDDGFKISVYYANGSNGGIHIKTTLPRDWFIGTAGGDSDAGLRVSRNSNFSNYVLRFYGGTNYGDVRLGDSGVITIDDSLYVMAGVSADNYTDRCYFPAKNVNATEVLLGIKGENQKENENEMVGLDHSSLGILKVIKNGQECRDLGNTVSMLIKAFQESHAEREALRNHVDDLEERLKMIEKKLYK